MNSPIVSIITPTFNRAHLLSRVWRSMRDESVSFEWIVVDDSSDDDTPSVIRSFDDPRIIFTRLSRNSGQNTARNVGVRRSRGAYVIFLDSDDELAVHGLRNAVDAISAAPRSVGAVLMMAVPTFSRKAMAVLPDGTLLTEEDLVVKRKLRGDRAVIYRREVFAKQMLPEKYRSCEQVFVFGISRWWNYFVVNKPVTLVNRNGSHSSSPAEITRISTQIAQSWEDVIANHSSALKKNKGARSSLYMIALYRYGVGGDWTSLRRVFTTLRRDDRSYPTAMKAIGIALAGVIGHLGGDYLRLAFIRWRFAHGGASR
jgi:glycosyltransferase involved in cell wall biosynthesis